MFREITVFYRTAVIGDIKICALWIYLEKEGKRKGWYNLNFAVWDLKYYYIRRFVRRRADKIIVRFCKISS